jgi:hypothetical protein
VTKGEYEKALGKLNQTIDMFETHYKPLLAMMQDSDEKQISQVKTNMDRFAKSVSSLGDNFKVRGEEMQ